MTPTGRTLKLLRDEGWIPGVVELWIAGANIRRDLFGIGDVLAMKIGEPLLMIQCTATANMASRLKKAKAESRLRTWLDCGHRFEVWGWAKRDNRWECRRCPMVSDDLAGVAAMMPPRRKRRAKEPCLWG